LEHHDKAAALQTAMEAYVQAGGTAESSVASKQIAQLSTEIMASIKYEEVIITCF
jgi:hypothetical protein